MTDEEEEPVQVFMAHPDVLNRIEATFWLVAVEAGADLDKLQIIPSEFVPEGQIYCFPNGLPDLEKPIKTTFTWDWERTSDSLHSYGPRFTFPPVD